VRTGTGESSCPPVTVVIAAKDEAEVLPTTLARLRELDYPADRLTVIVAVDEGDDRAAAAAVQDGLDIRVVRSAPGRGKPAALNDLLPDITDDLALFLDADSLPDRDLLRIMTAELESGGCDAASGRAYPLNRAEGIFPDPLLLESAIQAALMSGNGRRRNFTYVPEFCSLIRTSCIRNVGGWDASALAEGSDLALRLWAGGCTICETPARVGIEAPSRLRTLVAQRKRWYRGSLDIFFSRYAFLKSLPASRRLDAAIHLLSPVFVSLGPPLRRGLPGCRGNLPVPAWPPSSWFCGATLPPGTGAATPS
jgi:cellulose synthase/poly-beta-1,6-N-acetylglucosamine synthase-like glycosyltransferase